MKIALLGFGTVGKGFYELAEGRVCVKTVLSRRPRPELTCRVTDDFDEIVSDPEIGVVVEVMGGIEPAYTYISRALRAGKHVVTANKQLMCAKFAELTRLARENGAALRCTAAAGGGIGWLTALSRAAELDEILAVEGIVNGTTNFMLSAMTAQGAEYADALKRAQALGYAEADPAADVEGFDARRKLVLSADLAFGVQVQEEDVPCVGISSITAQDIREAGERKLVFRLIARAERGADGVSAFVCPTLYSENTAEAQTSGTDNRISLIAAHIGKQSFSGAGAGGWATGSNVLRDCLDIQAGCRSFYAAEFTPCALAKSGAEHLWLFRKHGQYLRRTCSVREAFALYEQYRKEDPQALLARFAERE